MIKYYPSETSWKGWYGDAVMVFVLVIRPAHLDNQPLTPVIQQVCASFLTAFSNCWDNNKLKGDMFDLLKHFSCTSSGPCVARKCVPQTQYANLHVATIF